jgi:non-canonical poly(A) RNA polymerase PAPD5/7
MPWMGDKKGYFHDNLYLSLHEEIIDFTRFMSPHADEIEQRKKLVEQFREIVTSLWEHATVETFGSAETQMFLPKSDVDLVILNAPDGKDPLFQLAEQLEQRALVSYLEVIDKARIPIVKFVDKESNLSVDVAFNTAGGLATADLVKHYMRMFPSFRPLTLVLKYYLSQRSLNETYNGGIGSFMLQLMVVSFLQHYRRQLGAAYDDVNYNNLGKLLIGFFTLYGKELNYNEVGISVRNGGEYFRKSDRGWYDEARPYLLSVENPNEPSLDVGKNSYEIRTVRRSFEYARQVLVSEIQRRGKFHPLPGSMLGTIIPADSDLLAREGPNEFGFDILHHDPKKTAEIRKRYEARRNEEMKKNQEEEKLKQSFSRRNNGDGKSPPYKRWRRTNKNF